MHSMLLSGNGLIIPLKTGVLSKLNLPHTHTQTHTDRHASGTPTWVHIDTHMSADLLGMCTDIHATTGILSQTNLLLSGS